MKLYLAQHGEAVPEKVDPSRPLTDKGQLDVQKVASFLKDAGLVPLTLLHSGKTRARQTAEIIVRCLGADCRLKERTNLPPNDPVQDLLEEITRETGDLMIVGHLPFLAKVASALLIGPEAKNIIGFQQGSVVCLQRLEDQTWQVAWMVTPELFK